jgi:AraC-like DNA-binding protein
MKVDVQAVRQINERLKTKFLQLVSEPGESLTAIEGLRLYRRNEDLRIECFNEPVLGVIVQGEKRSVIADKEYRYGEGSYIAYGVDLPSVSHIVGASAKKPHLALSLHLDRYILSQLAAGGKPAPNNRPCRGVTVAAATADLLDACLRLVNLLDTPERIPVLAPMIIREIHYYLLTSPEGEDFRLLGTYETPNSQIARAISWLRENYHETVHLAEFAEKVNMSQTSFGRHFNRITGMSPLQFQKRLRLYEAQRLMLTEDKSAETAAYEVGYESPTQFNREYKRQFGEAPHRDVQRILAK